MPNISVQFSCFYPQKIRSWVFNIMPPVRKAIFSIKVKVKVTRSLTLGSFKRVSLVEYVRQIWRLYFYGSMVKENTRSKSIKIKRNIGSEMNFHFIRCFTKRVVFLYIPEPWKLKKGRDLTQPYDKHPKTTDNAYFRTDLRWPVGTTTVIQKLWLI